MTEALTLTDLFVRMVASNQICVCQVASMIVLQQVSGVIVFIPKENRVPLELEINTVVIW